jgi:SAM-dependent methyltransferase
MRSSIETVPLRQWQSLWAATYSNAGAVADPALNLAGWVSSYTGTPIRPAEMKDWVENTVGRILALSPRRVLEIGCGTGLLLLRVAPRCEEYHGLDFTPEATAYLAGCLAKNPIPGASVERRAADDLAHLPAGHYDLVVLNSVVQYFPNRAYLMKVLAGAIATLAPGGRIFLGDLRSLPLLRAFHVAVQLAQADPAMTLRALRERVGGLIAAERELVLEPDFFSSLPARLPRVSHAVVQVKRGRPRNELTRFRYNVVLHLEGGEPPEAPPAAWLTWGSEITGVTALKKHLTDARPESLGVRAVPNARLAAELTAVEILSSGEGLAPVSDLEEALRRARPTGVDPEDLYALGQSLPYRVEVTWSAAGERFVDAVFRRYEAA